MLGIESMEDYSLKLPWDSYTYETWIKQFKVERTQVIREFFNLAINQWHKNFEILYTKSDTTPGIINADEFSSLVFSARGGAAFACDMAGYYFKNSTFSKLQRLNSSIKNDTQAIEYEDKNLYFFVTFSGTTGEIINSLVNLIHNFNLTTDESKQLSLVIVTSKSPSETYNGDVKFNRIRLIYNSLDKKAFDPDFDIGFGNDDSLKRSLQEEINKIFSRKYKVYLISIPNDPFYRDTHSIQPYVLFSGIMKGINQYFKLEPNSEKKNFETQYKEDTTFLITKNGRFFDNINTSIRIAADYLKQKMPFIYYDSNSYIIAERMQNVVNENAKILSSTSCISEIQHNHIVPWTKGRYGLSIPIFIPSADQESIKNIDTVVKTLEVDNKKLQFHKFEFFNGISEKNKALFIGLYSADLLSVQLSILNNVDPSDNNAIFEAKNTFAGEVCKLPEMGTSDLNVKYFDEVTKVKIGGLEDKINNLKLNVEKEITDLDNGVSSRLDSLERRILQIFSVFVIVITITVTLVTSLTREVTQSQGLFTTEIFDHVILVVAVGILLTVLAIYLILQHFKK
jgi:hypothetical protein